MKKLLSAPLSPRKIIEYLLLFLLLASVLSLAVYGGYWYGKQQVEPSQEAAPKTQEPTPPKAADGTTGWNVFRNLEAARKYSFRYPDGWAIARDHKKYWDSQDMLRDVTTVSKGDYEIQISQASGTSYSACLFPGDSETDAPLSIPVTNCTKAFSLAGGEARRCNCQEDVGGFQHYAICQDEGGGHYINYTAFGFISYAAPAGSTNQMLEEMDSIVSTLEAVK